MIQDKVGRNKMRQYGVLQDNIRQYMTIQDNVIQNKTRTHKTT